MSEFAFAVVHSETQEAMTWPRRVRRIDELRGHALCGALLAAALMLGGCHSGGHGNSPAPPSTPPSTPPPSTPPSSDVSQVVSTAGGTVETPNHAVKLVIPPDALDATTTIAVAHLDPTDTPAGLPTVAFEAGRDTVVDAFDFGPDGLRFAKPVRLTISYDPAKLPSGTPPEGLAIAKLREDGLIQLAGNLQVDAANHTVSGDVTGFSNYALIGLAPPPPNCGYSDERFNDDLLVDSLSVPKISLTFDTLRTLPGCTGDPIFFFVIEQAFASLPGPGGTTREPLDGDFAPATPIGNAIVWPNSPSAKTPSGGYIAHDLDVTAGKSYRFRVKGYSLYGHVWLPTTSILVDVPLGGSPQSPPPPPDYFAVSWDDPYINNAIRSVNSRTPRVRLNWTPVAGADDMRIERRLANELTYSVIAPAVSGGVTYYDEDVNPDGHYFYRVVAHNTAGDSTFLDQELAPLGSNAATSDPAFAICVESGASCVAPGGPFYAAPGVTSSVRFQVRMVPTFYQPGGASAVNVPDCEIRFAVFNATDGVLPAQITPFVPEQPLQHKQQNGLQIYDVDLRLDVAPTANYGVHGLTLYATGCAGTVAKQPLLVDVRPAGTWLLLTAIRGAGQIKSTPVAAGQPADIDCPTGSCGAYFADGASITLNADTAPGANTHFTQWENDCSGLSSPAALTVNADKFCTAVFATNPATAATGLISAGTNFSYVRDASSLLYAWGSDTSETLGNGAGNNPSNVPIRVQIASNVGLVGKNYGGTGHGLAILPTGEVWGWGINNSGQLGTGSMDTQPVPSPMKDPTGTTIGNAVMAAAGSTQSLVLRADGSVVTTGQNPGDGTVSRLYAAPVPGLTGVASIAGGAGTSYAVKADGTVWAWGDLGDGTAGGVDYHSTPIQVGGLTNIVDVAAGYYFAIALDGNGDVWSWGVNANGQLGDGTTTTRLAPAKIAGLTGVKAIAAGLEHAFAVMGDGSLRAWGRGANGRLGLGDQGDRLTPTTVSGLGSVIAVAGGSAHSLAVLSDGTLWAWGSNVSGALGLGTAVSAYLTPQQVPGLQLN
jgi:alpha-tubulin suppressor-like RCC1 family protein